MPIKFVEETFCVSKEFWYRKFSSKGGGSFTVLSKIFLSHRTKKNSPGNHYVFQKFSGRENILWIRGGGGGYHDFPSKSFCLTVPKYFIGEHFAVSEKFFYRKSKEGGGESLWRNPSVFQKISDIEKNLGTRGGISRFSVEIFMSHSAENFRKGILLFLRKFLVSKSFMDEKRGLSRFPVKIFWSHSAEKVRGHPLNVSEILWYRKILCIIGGITIFRQKFFGLTVPKKFLGISWMFQKIWGIEKLYA